MREFLGTVPKKWQLVETFWDCPEISESNKFQSTIPNLNKILKSSKNFQKTKKTA